MIPSFLKNHILQRIDHNLENISFKAPRRKNMTDWYHSTFHTVRSVMVKCQKHLILKSEASADAKITISSMRLANNWPNVTTGKSSPVFLKYWMVIFETYAKHDDVKMMLDWWRHQPSHMYFSCVFLFYKFCYMTPLWPNLCLHNHENFMYKGIIKLQYYQRLKEIPILNLIFLESILRKSARSNLTNLI